MRGRVILGFLYLSAFGGVASAQVVAPDQSQVFKRDSLSDLKQSLFLQCQDQARAASGYLGYIPSTYTGPNPLDASLSSTRDSGIFAIPFKGFDEGAKISGTLGGKFSIKFGNRASKTPAELKRERRRDFRKNFDGCLLGGR